MISADCAAMCAGGIAGEEDALLIDVEAFRIRHNVSERGADLPHRRREARLQGQRVIDPERDIAARGENRQVAAELGARAGDEAAAMHPHDRRKRLIRGGRREHIEQRVIVRRVTQADLGANAFRHMRRDGCGNLGTALAEGMADQQNRGATG